MPGADALRPTNGGRVGTLPSSHAGLNMEGIPAGFAGYRRAAAFGVDSASGFPMRNLLFTGKFGQRDPNRADYNSPKQDSPIPSDIDGMSNSGQFQALHVCGSAVARMPEYLSAGAQRNTVRVFAGSLRPASPWMQGYRNFCDFRGRPSFPIQGGAILLWSTLSRLVKRP